tara:strand:+ start:302 stop:472 length:171 start_codon:yes stop_codon:yes gene_type:complete
MIFVDPDRILGHLYDINDLLPDNIDDEIRHNLDNIIHYIETKSEAFKEYKKVMENI